MKRSPNIPDGLILVIAAACLLLLASARLRGLLANTALLACGTIAISLPLGVVLGTVIAKIDIPGRRVVAGAMVALLFVPLYVQAAAWNAVLGTGGWIPQALAQAGEYADPWLAGWRGAIWVHAMGAVPWAALMTAASLRAVERRLEEESLLDASPQRVLMRVSVRRASDGIFAAAIWIAIIGATEIAVTDLYQVRTFAEEIYTQASLGSLSGDAGGFYASDLALGIAMIALLVVAVLRLIAPWMPKAAAIAADATWKWRPTGVRWIVLAAMSLLMALLVLIPLAGLVWKAGIDVHQRGNQFERSWSAAKAATMVVNSPWEHRREWGWSIAAGAMAAVAATLLALLLAWTARTRARAVKPLVGCVALGFAVPAPLWGVWTIALLNHPSDSFLAPLTVLYDRTLLAPVLVQVARALPLVGLWLWAQLSSVPSDLLEAARSEGASPLTQLLRIAIPLRWAGLFAALGMALVLAVSELSATLLVAPPGVTPISVHIFQFLHQGVDDQVAALALSFFALAGLALLLWRLAGRVRQ